MASVADTIRSFVAIELPPAVTGALRTLQTDIRSDGLRAKWVRSEQIHLTLKFFGEIQAADADRIAACIAAAVADIPTFQLDARGIGVFPNIRRARILWTGIGGETDVLGSLQQQIEQSLEPVGFKPEGRRFTAHLTLARFKAPVDPDSLIAVMKQHGDFRSEIFKVQAIYLVKSDLTQNGPIYTKMGSFRLNDPD